MEDIISEFRAYSQQIEEKYANPHAGKEGLSNTEMIAQLELVRDKIPEIEKDLLDLANYLVAEYDVEVDDDLQTKLKEEFVDTLKRIISSYAPVR